MSADENSDNSPVFKAFETYAAACNAVAEIAVHSIDQAVISRGSAAILLSGGSTPGPAYTLLSQKPLVWDKTVIGLVDDRWVPETDDGSNSAMIRRTVLQGPAAKAGFVPMYSGHNTAEDGISIVSQQMDLLTQKTDLCLLGMGLDGHTASWFPGSKGLESALDITSPDILAAIDATGCAGAGSYPERMTLRLPAIMGALKLVLFITGEEKRRVWEESEKKSVFEAPVGALRAAGKRLTIIWAP